jgi:aminopeptidase N
VRWRSAARYAQQSIRAHSEFTGLPYAWSHMTAVEGDGIIGGGMEYPMMTLIGAYTTASDTALYGVVSHELAHMWVPMMVASDERRFGWLDEGTTDFNEMEATKSMYPGTHPEPGERDRYLRWALQGEDGPLMRRSDYQYPGAAFVVSSYYKPATILVALRGLLGDETFVRAYREFFDRWAYRHPYPWDLWNTFDDVSGRDLGWFWRTWYFETWLLDQSVGSVTAQGDSTRIVVEDQGNAPMPARLTITLASGDTLKREVPVESWLRGARSATVTVPGRATRVEIDAENVFPDADRENNVWTGAQ